MSALTRRLLLGAAATAIAGFTLEWAPLEAQPRQAGSSGLPNLTVELTFPGGSPVSGTLTYDIANGTDLGSYTAPKAGFTQRCIRVRHASLPNFLVDFRPDTTGGRVEVVFWNGEVLGTVPSGHYRNLPAYIAVVKLNGVAQTDWRGVSSWSIPYHYWGNRWRWQSALRPVIRTASQVYSDGFLPPMSKAAARITGYSGVIVPTPPAVPSPSNFNGKNGDGTAMTAGTAYGYTGYLYTPFMIPDDRTARIWGYLCAGDTGGYRDEQGLVTQWQGDWLVNGTASSLNSFMQQAEFFCCQANALFLPHQVDGGPVNQKANLTNYKASTYCNFGRYYNIVTGMTGGISTGAFNGSVSGNVLTVTSAPFNNIAVGMILKSYANITYDGLLPGTYIVSQISGTAGGVGTYQLSRAQTASPAQMICFATSGEFYSKGDEHAPMACYLPYVITEDPFYIEGEQYGENASIQASIYYKENLIGNLAGDGTGAGGINGSLTVPVGLPGTSEERAIGWSVKRIASSWRMTPASGAPSWMLPRNVWAAYSSDVSRWIDYQKETWPTDQWYTVFHSFSVAPTVGGSGGDGPQTFYKAYAVYCFAFAHLVGLPVPAAAGHSAPSSWHAHADYAFDFIRKITDPALASGWNVQNPLLHNMDPATYMSNQGGATSGCTPGRANVKPVGVNCINTYAGLETYAGAYMRESGSVPYPSNPSPGYIGGDTQLGNAGPLAASIAVAKSIGLTGAAASLAQVNAMIDFSYPQRGYLTRFHVQDGFDGS